MVCDGFVYDLRKSPQFTLLRRKKVVAVFAHGPDWQFKGWKWGERDGKEIGPAEIFSRCHGFHVHYDNVEVHPNIKQWNVKLLPVSEIDALAFYLSNIKSVLTF